MSTKAEKLVEIGVVVAEIFGRICQFLPSRAKSAVVTLVISWVKAAFHDSDTDILATSSRGRRRVVRLPRSACRRTNFRKSIVHAGRVGENPRKDVGVGIGVDVVECGLY